MGVHTHRSIRREDASEQLQHLSEEVSRISATLARLTSAPHQGSERVPEFSRGAPRPSSSVVKGVIKARRLRDRYFDEELFADPAWDILLELLHAEISQYRVSVSSLCDAAHVPTTTALRYINTMTDSGLLLRRPDPSDGRRIFMELAPSASDALHRYFACLKDPAVV
jgi:DNA-binding MarR family transcriptional regulator